MKSGEGIDIALNLYPCPTHNMEDLGHGMMCRLLVCVRELIMEMLREDKEREQCCYVTVVQRDPKTNRKGMCSQNGSLRFACQPSPPHVVFHSPHNNVTRPCGWALVSELNIPF